MASTLPSQGYELPVKTTPRNGEVPSILYSRYPSGTALIDLGKISEGEV